jgi:uncharacterized protein YndB with AHSA1/START domain
MARNEILIAAQPEAVFAVLADPGMYPRWVVGAREVREADDSWPAAGSRFAHSVGAGPLRSRGQTEVVRVEEPLLLELRASAWPAATANVRIELVPEAGGTRVVVVEDPEPPLGPLLVGPLGHLALRFRNRAGLARLRGLVEARTQPRPTKVGSVPPSRP